jgi:hypothetical protein
MKSSKARKQRSARRRSKRNAGIPRNFISQPELRTTMVWTRKDQLNLPSLQAGHYQWLAKGNALFNPWDNGMVTQPIGYDQINKLYKKYTVHASRMEITITNSVNATTPLSDTHPICAVVFPSVYTTEPIDRVVAYSQPYARKVFCNRPGTAGNIKTIQTARRTTSSMFGVTALDEDFKANVNSNPARLWYWHIYLESVGLLNMAEKDPGPREPSSRGGGRMERQSERRGKERPTVGNDDHHLFWAVVDVKITYDVTFHNRFLLTESSVGSQVQAPSVLPEVKSAGEPDPELYILT